MTGFNTKINNIIGRTSRTANVSAFDIAKRLGIKSASKENKLVMSTNDMTDATASLPNNCSR